ncbi:MAG: MFS transporter, partial [Acetobacteraceae bacterium]|nr:MFS transporter [Acetobacteraceae bacterium]
MSERYRWVIVAAGAVLGCVALGTVFSLAVFLQPIAADTGWSRAGISAAMTFSFLALGAAAFGWGTLTDRYGPRPVVLAGTLLLSAGVALASRCHSLLAFQLVYGVLVGVGTGAVFAPMMATVTGWFDKQRSLAVSLVSAGMGVAPMTLSPFARWLVSNTDWRTAQLAIAALALVVMTPTALLVRRAPAQRIAAGITTDDRTTVWQALRSPQFVVIACTYFCCCATHAGPIFHTVSYAIACGIPAMAAVSIYSLEGLAGLG